MFYYMSKAESFQNNGWFDAISHAHGKDGPLLTAPHDPAPISNRVLESFQFKGLPLKSDIFSTGEFAEGCGHAVRSIYEGIRTTSFDYIGSTQQYPNIDIVNASHVDKIIFDNDEEGLRATGVKLQDPDGRGSFVEANQELILTSGTYGSSTVLLRSGIGPKAELNNLGVSTIVDVPRVGKNLMDHFVS
jgi:choline dehydrogenase-like flavoprotein